MQLARFTAQVVMMGHIFLLHFAQFLMCAVLQLCKASIGGAQSTGIYGGSSGEPDIWVWEGGREGGVVGGKRWEGGVWWGEEGGLLSGGEGSYFQSQCSHFQSPAEVEMETPIYFHPPEEMFSVLLLSCHHQFRFLAHFCKVLPKAASF